HHEDAGRKQTQPFEIGVLCLDPRPRTEDFNVKAELVRPDVRTEIRALAVSCSTADLPDHGALRGHDTRVAAKRPASCRYLWQKQRRRHQRTDAVVGGADITP